MVQFVQKCKEKYFQNLSPHPLGPTLFFYFEPFPKGYYYYSIIYKRKRVMFAKCFTQTEADY